MPKKNLPDSRLNLTHVCIQRLPMPKRRKNVRRVTFRTFTRGILFVHKNQKVKMYSALHSPKFSKRQLFLRIHATQTFLFVFVSFSFFSTRVNGVSLGRDPHGRLD